MKYNNDFRELYWSYDDYHPFHSQYIWAMENGYITSTPIPGPWKKELIKVTFKGLFAGYLAVKDFEKRYNDDMFDQVRHAVAYE